MASSSVQHLSLKTHRVSKNQTLRIVGARIAVDARTALLGEIDIVSGTIRLLRFGSSPRVFAQSRAEGDPTTIDLTGYMILPGLINAHDHLELNLFPRLGKGPYPNARLWAEDIHHPDQPPLAQHLAVPKDVRLWWGATKNLLCGVTTVCHHNAAGNGLFDDDFPVRVVRRFGWAHSLAFEKDVARAFQETPDGAPFIIHLGEGTDEAARNEIFELDRLGALDSRTVIVHGVALDEAGRALLRRRAGSLIWCPSSNLFTLGTTLDPRSFSPWCPVALGSDSALTAEGDLLDEVRVAMQVTNVEPQEIFEMVTQRAAQVLQLEQGEGTLISGGVADLIAVADSGGSPAETFASCTFRDVELVMVAGRVQLLSSALRERWPKEFRRALASLRIEGVERLIAAPRDGLIEETRDHLGTEIRLAGKRVNA